MSSSLIGQCIKLNDFNRAIHELASLRSELSAARQELEQLRDWKAQGMHVHSHPALRSMQQTMRRSTTLHRKWMSLEGRLRRHRIWPKRSVVRRLMLAVLNEPQRESELAQLQEDFRSLQQELVEKTLV